MTQHCRRCALVFVIDTGRQPSSGANSMNRLAVQLRVYTRPHVIRVAVQAKGE
jgi:hypothetical protein